MYKEANTHKRAYRGYNLFGPPEFKGRVPVFAWARRLNRTPHCSTTKEGKTHIMGPTRLDSGVRHGPCPSRQCPHHGNYSLRLGSHHDGHYSVRSDPHHDGHYSLRLGPHHGHYSLRLGQNHGPCPRRQCPHHGDYSLRLGPHHGHNRTHSDQAHQLRLTSWAQAPQTRPISWALPCLYCSDPHQGPTPL